MKKYLAFYTEGEDEILLGDYDSLEEADEALEKKCTKLFGNDQQKIIEFHEGAYVQWCGKR